MKNYCHNSSMADQYAHEQGEWLKAEIEKERQQEEVFELLLNGETVNAKSGKQYGPAELIEAAVNDDAEAFDDAVIEAAKGRPVALRLMLDKAANELTEVIVP